MKPPLSAIDDEFLRVISRNLHHLEDEIFQRYRGQIVAQRALKAGRKPAPEFRNRQLSFRAPIQYRHIYYGTAAYIFYRAEAANK
jgi:hypothetical protein